MIHLPLEASAVVSSTVDASQSRCLPRLGLTIAPVVAERGTQEIERRVLATNTTAAATAAACGGSHTESIWIRA